jgi:hypothetical protein
MLQAIKPKYFGPNNRRESRIVASAAAGRKSYPYQREHNEDRNHALAAQMFADDLRWMEHGERLVGGTLDSSERVFVLVEGPEND